MKTTHLLALCALASTLAFDPKKGVFPGDEEATRLCDWKYRDPWKLPS